jgi:hypothetical protein
LRLVDVRNREGRADVRFRDNIYLLMMNHVTGVRFHGSFATRLGQALCGRVDDWVLTAVTVGVVGKIAFFSASLLIYGISWQVFGADPRTGFSGSARPLSVEHVFDLLVFAPLFESLIVLSTVWLLHKPLKAAPLVTIAVSGAVHVPLHGISATSLSVFPVFALHALVQMNWMSRGKAAGGYRVIVAAHAITNLIAVLASALLP